MGNYLNLDTSTLKKIYMVGFDSSCLCGGSKQTEEHLKFLFCYISTQTERSDES